MKVAFMNDTRVKRLLLILIGLLLLSYVVKSATANGDFEVYLGAADLIIAGKNPYNEWITVGGGEGYCLYLYSPLWAMLMIPFRQFDNFVPNLVWLLANMYFVYRIWKLLVSYIDISRLTKKQINWILFLSIALSIRFILHNFEMIQMTLFILWGGLESMHLFENNKPLKGGLLLALVINIKILPLVFIPYLIYRKRFSGAVFTVLFSVVLIFLPALFLGWHRNLFFLSEWWSVINPSSEGHLIESGLGGHGLSSLIPCLLTETANEINLNRNILNLSVETAILWTNVVRLALIVSTLYFFKWPPFKPAQSSLYRLREIAVLCLLIPLIFPHQQKYAFALVIPAIFYLSYFVVFNRPNAKRKIIIGHLFVAFLLMIFTTDGIVGREINNITQHYHTITWGALILFSALVIATPKSLETIISQNEKDKTFY